jgi:hypothetical protein
MSKLSSAEKEQILKSQNHIEDGDDIVWFNNDNITAKWDESAFTTELNIYNLPKFCDKPHYALRVISTYAIYGNTWYEDRRSLVDDNYDLWMLKGIPLSEWIEHYPTFLRDNGINIHDEVSSLQLQIGDETLEKLIKYNWLQFVNGKIHIGNEHRYISFVHDCNIRVKWNTDGTFSVMYMKRLNDPVGIKGLENVSLEEITSKVAEYRKCSIANINDYWYFEGYPLSKWLEFNEDFLSAVTDKKGSVYKTESGSIVVKDTDRLDKVTNGLELCG